MSERETQGGDGELGACHICGRTFPRQEELSQHLMDEHEGAETLGDPRDDDD
jgi:Zinc finger, C2H2 type